MTRSKEWLCAERGVWMRREYEQGEVECLDGGSCKEEERGGWMRGVEYERRRI